MNLIPRAVRDAFGWALTPIVRLLIRMRVRPNVVSTAGTVVIVGSAAAFALGMIHWGGFLLLVSGLFDMVDGRVAREGAMTTPFGAFFDSTLDRVGESALFTGIGVFFLRGGVEPDRLTLALVACFVALAASLLVSYARARAEGLGFTCRVGIAQRAERVILLGAPTMFFGAGNRGALLLWIMAFLALVTTVTVVQRVAYVARVAGRPVAGHSPRPRDALPGHASALPSRKGH